jgi:hypothetical protein
VLIAESVQRRATCWTAGVRFPTGPNNHLLHSVCTGFGAHPVSTPMATEGFSPRVKPPGHEADHPPPLSADVKNTWRYAFAPPYVLMA